uniref:uncharacterized protein LOC122594350 n=1 Tax=Erigeron canadensis TaxID=72917 RepID=UPI001CB999F1|nr:uncharacterized protein LOC122594350 [Erigeron canadensis]
MYSRTIQQIIGRAKLGNPNKHIHSLGLDLFGALNFKPILSSVCKRVQRETLHHVLLTLALTSLSHHHSQFIKTHNFSHSHSSPPSKINNILSILIHITTSFPLIKEAGSCERIISDFSDTLMDRMVLNKADHTNAIQVRTE